MRCYNCGSEMPANLSFCIHCARRMVFPFPPFNRFALAKKEVTLPCNLPLDEVDIRIFQSCFNNVLFNLRGRNVLPNGYEYFLHTLPSAFTWGEYIHIRVFSTKNGTSVNIFSRLVIPICLFSFGRNKKNIRRIMQRLDMSNVKI